MKVLVSLTRRTQYRAIVEMTQVEYERLSVELDNNQWSARDEINDLIDPRTDWQDDSLSCIDQFEPHKPKS